MIKVRKDQISGLKVRKNQNNRKGQEGPNQPVPKFKETFVKNCLHNYPAP